MCCSTRGHKELDMAKGRNNNNRYRLVLSSRDTEKRQGKDKENTYEVIIRGGLLRWYSGKESAYRCRRHKRCGFDPWVGKISWSRKWHLGNPMDRRAWRDTVHGVTKNQIQHSHGRQAHRHILGLLLSFLISLLSPLLPPSALPLLPPLSPFPQITKEKRLGPW